MKKKKPIIKRKKKRGRKPKPKPVGPKRYYLVSLYCNKKLMKSFIKTEKKILADEMWDEMRTEKPPRFVKMDTSRGEPRLYQLMLIYPAHSMAKPVYARDSFGRNYEVILESPEYRVKHIIPYWKEETIYNHETEKQMRYHEFFNMLNEVNEIAMIYKINNKIVLQIDDVCKLFSIKNINDCQRLFDFIKEDLLAAGHGNFLFVKDVCTDQRSNIYNQLEAAGFNKYRVTRHYTR